MPGHDKSVENVYNRDMSAIKENLQRSKKGMAASAVGIVCNLVLAAAKIAVGLMTGLLSVAADGFNNLSDCGSGVVTLVSFRIAQKPADSEHPYGHQRAEYVASMVIAFFVFALAVELIRESIEKIIEGTAAMPPSFVFAVLAASVAVKGGMFFFYRSVGTKIHSEPLKNSATDSACDCLATLAVIVGTLLSAIWKIPADGWVGIAVSLFILWQGIGIFRKASSSLLGQAPDRTLLKEIESDIAQGKGVLGVHDLHLYSYGPSHCFATAHVERDAQEPAMLSHAALDELERSVKEKRGVELTLHLDPVDLNDGERAEIEWRLRSAVEGMYEGLNLHDFRLIRGAKTKLVFEVGVPFSCRAKDEEIKNDMVRAVSVLGDYDCVVSIERE